MSQEQRPPPPSELKPWYYQDWFLFPAFIFWPVWAVLILRSPWHNGLVSGAIAWAMLIVGSYLIVWRQLVQSGGLNQVTVTLIIPGLILMVVTQALWLGDRKKLRERGQQPDSSTAVTGPFRSRRAGSQSSRRRRGPRSGRFFRGR
jgi:hypothetical protein